jgi:hypothetical protein
MEGSNQFECGLDNKQEFQSEESVSAPNTLIGPLFFKLSLFFFSKKPNRPKKTFVVSKKLDAFIAITRHSLKKTKELNK